MASETNELTFVRCPTCRSLVPASASRCRICNATLEAGADKTSTSETPSSGSRVRQKTVTASAEEIKSIVGGSSAPPPPSAPAPVQVSSPPISSPAIAKPAARPQDVTDDAFDPLGAFLQDLDADEPPKSAKPAEPLAPSAKSTPRDEDEDLLADLFGDDDDEQDESDIVLGGVKADEDEDDDLDDDEGDEDDDDFDIFDDPSFEELGASTSKPAARKGESIAPRSKPQAPPPPQRPVAARPPEPPQQRQTPPPPPPRQEAPPRQDAPRRPEVNRQQTAPRDAQKGSRPEQKPQQETRAPQEQRKTQSPPQARPAAPMGMRPKMGGPAARPEGKPSRPADAIALQESPHEAEVFEAPRNAPPQVEREPSRKFVEAREERAPNPPPVRPQQPARPAPKAPEQVREPRVEPRASAKPHREEHADEGSVEHSSGPGPRMHKMKPGRLFGWLVSFESPDGRAIELRSGRFFVTGTSIRGSDLILEDQSISTPHALMSINEKGFLLQDLMSERGTFVRSKGDAQYRREEGIIEVRHGDWIRFGDVEFLVTIVPG